MAPLSNITKVLITGFGAFQDVPNNPSYEVASRLPTSLSDSIHLVVYPSAIPVAYHPVINLIPNLIQTHQPDIVLSIGVAPGRSYFAVEQTAHKNGYNRVPDVENKTFTAAENDAVWGSQPPQLSTSLDLEDVVERWQDLTSNIRFPFEIGGDPKAKAKRITKSMAGSFVDVRLGGNVMQVEDVRWSDNVGTYLCGFIYFTDMVEMGKAGKRNVAFMHVPMLEDEEEITTGVEVTVALVKAIVESWKESAV
ncbi:peptidase C15, pyroglutamyl peptidase I-like protein [Lindgomyces ingoldianus]|uniref:Peptidase C15, pyroglutamyl peptidase I-like protein n=1 Tax=Lindgomyces ingoldianus TaxID=673940 RepID=A0ACB6QPU9_9PLEO|nr:peptidase C15, pyroglutamyl peptidase I-like protein [Lindgomyces ingoldianus]KAF2469054.1 peptidase C15, pyroglutamyl peptidase I-like protein [Lindgomyces ingoldianus]